MFRNRLTSVVIALFAAGPLCAQTPPIVPAAVQWIEKHPTLEGRLGLAEIERVHNSRRAGMDALQRIAGRPAEVQELLCWRMLPVAPVERDAFSQQLGKLKAHDPQNRWLPVWELYLLATESNRAPFAAAVLQAPASTPERFPAASAESAHLELLRGLGVPRVQAGVEVISARNYEPLHALRDLDRAMTREAEFADSGDRKADAKRIRALRDEYRRAYLRAAKHLVEKLFALRLLGATGERDALLAKAKALPYLHDRQRLASLLLRVDEEQAWKRLIEPLLADELALIETPPDLAEIQAAAVAQLQINARTKSVQEKTVRYDGAVRFRLAGIEILCEHLTLLQANDPAAAVVSGSDGVRLHGFAEYPAGINADRFSFHAETGAFTLGGDIRLRRLDKTVKLRACTLTQRGELRDPRSLLDDFRDALIMHAKLELLPKIARVYDDAELPDEVRYVAALNLLRPHLTWHAPYLPPLPDHAVKYKRLDEAFDAREWSGHAWQAALGGEPWMLDDIPQARVEHFRASLQAWHKQYNADPRNHKIAPPDVPIPNNDLYFWRLKDPAHPDVARAIRLLQGFEAGALGGKAYRWISELRRNNTVVTFDISGAAPVGRKHSLLMDVRNAETVAFKLYRVHDPRELLFATKNIGKDFIYRQHGLDDFRLRELIKGDERLLRDVSRIDRSEFKRALEFTPAWKKEQLVREWSERVADLPHRPGERERRRWWRSWRDDDDWHDEADAFYFDDECSQYRPRIDKAYRPRGEDRLSSWQCDRVVQIPEKALAEAGAYVLVAEANGQTAHVPIVVEPLSLTLRRCRDGVFVLASDTDGKKPLAGAKVYALDQHGEATTDKEGAAFARVLAHGDRAIVVHHQGRYAIGGFGQVFEGIYDSGDDERHLFVFERMKRAMRGEAKEASAHVYADRHVVAAYTDRPTYRPGQEVQFKLIVRKLMPEKSGAATASTFRGDDFDVKTKMVLSDLEREIAYALLDPKGQQVAQGTLKLSEFGTAAGSVNLNSESVLGAYTLRVHLGGEPRIVPEIFAVQHYRRPNIDVQVTGVPDKVTKPETLTLEVSGRYYFGPPVAGGVVDVRVVRKEFGKTVADAQGKLDEQGRAKIELRLPKALAAGAYVVVTSVTDESGRTVKTTAPLAIEMPDAPKEASGVDAISRFTAVGQELNIATTVKEIRVVHDSTARLIASKNGVAVLKFTAPGWYRLQAGGAGDDEATVFVYGGDQHPMNYAGVKNYAEDRGTRLHPFGWVNLSDFAWQEHGHVSRWERPSQHLFALFDRQSLKVGDKLRLLVYVPHKNAKLLFTIEGRTVLDYITMWSKDAGYQIVEIPIKERYFPNVYVQGRILTQDGQRVNEADKAGTQEKRLLEREDEEAADPHWCRIDVARAKGAPDAPTLNVQVETDRVNYRPGDSVRASIKVTDQAGRPQAAELSLAAIDESVFAFGEDNLDALPGFFRMPYEARRFQPKVWRSSVGSRWIQQGGVDKHLDQEARDMAKMSEKVLAQAAGMQKLESARTDLKEQHFALAPLPRLGGEMPAKQIPLAQLREHFHETAAWLPQLRTDANGVAQAAFTLPDSLTRYRLTSLALTKTTEVGVGRARITAGLPLAVQVFLPRFAIEKDRLLAVALIHNHTGAERDCAFSWDVTGAKAEMPLSGSVKVPANGSTKVGVWLRAEQIGTARVAFRAQAGKETDAEMRTLPVQPLGKAVEININEDLAVAPLTGPPRKQGEVLREGRVQLPAGFVARELHISLAASDLAQALDGLDYLVDYPYGCIEQTMSRFLPVVMIKHATQQSPVKLQPDIAKKLPQILEQGLTRLYGHQHADGSWGWFEKDSKNVPMSVYVVYGLARCQATGTKVDADVLRRGCAYLNEELRTGKHDAELTARTWYALALAGHADVKELEKLAREEGRQVQHDQPLVWCNLALACRAAGLNEAGERLWARVHERLRSSWWGHDTESFALILKTQLAFGAPYSECRTMAERLLARRHGTRWDHTRDTSWAIEALSNMLGYVPDKALVRKIEVTLAGKTILEVRDPAELKKLAWRVKLTADHLPAQEALEIRMKADGDEPIHVAVRATGVQRQDAVLASGQRVKLQRVIETLEEQPVQGPLKVGQVVRVRLKLDLRGGADYLLIEERRPALCEFADDRIAGPTAQSAVHQEFRDDRLCVFFARLPAGSHEIVYYLRAETPGRCSVLPGCAYPMYDEKTRGETASSKIEVLER
jgi:uncharacterized protein YfaS (alpha-2-macroglobulin family)